MSDPSEIVLGIKTRGGFLSTSVLVSEHSRHGVDGHVLCPIRIVDGPNSVDCRNRWTYRMLGWEPSWGERSVGRPAIRWEDRLEGFARSVGKNWRTVAMDRNQWQQMEQQFVEFEG